MRNNISSSVITFGAPSYTVKNTNVGGFVGYNATLAANFSNNYYAGTVGANGYFATQVAQRVGSGSNPNITDDAQIKRLADRVPTPSVEFKELNKETGIYSYANIGNTETASVEYVSSNPAIVQVVSSDINGAKIKAVGTGDATITVT
ncbi:MAG: hypothetical protein RR797_07345, partial [Christensenella sp.]